MSIESKIGDNLRLWLSLKGIKQSNLATHLKISNSAMSQIISNKIGVDLNRKKEIAKLLEIEPSLLDSSPLQVFNFNNCKSETGGNTGVQNVYNSDSQLGKQVDVVIKALNSLVVLLEKLGK
jgi:transcriptional regulator with XRE-family HTH domain